MGFLKLDWKSWLSIGLGSTSALLLVALISQWKYASLGKQVSRSVTSFLVDHGAHVEGGVISGGVVRVPLKLHTAINSTILQMLDAVSEQMKQEAADQHPEDSSLDPTAQTYTGRQRSPASERASSASGHKHEQNPASSSKASLAPAAVKSGGRAAAPAVPAPSSPPRDDCGFTDPNRGKDHSGYDPAEFVPAKKGATSVDEMLRDDFE
jgi:hypothetical protein